MVKKAQIKLVSFDVDGTILRGRILYYLRVPKSLHDEIELQDVLFDQGKLGYEEEIQIQYELLSGLNVDEITPDPQDLPLIGDLQTTVEKLKRSGVRVVVLTDNPSFAAAPFRSCGFQDIIGSEIEVENGVLTRRMKVLTNKLTGLQEYCKRQGIGLESCAHVGDWINDIVVFKAVGLSVAFNPSKEDVSRAATYTVRSNSLLDVYNVLKASLSPS
jgi:HAD superfamily phosphoserine phosphatase-like hydrolase